MKSLKILGSLAVLTFMSVSAQALPLLSVTDALTLADPTQDGRLFRAGLPQDWVGSETFPGVSSTGTTFHYQTYLLNVGDTPFIQIEVDSNSGSTFVSAYDTAYAPNSAAGPNFGFDTNWLGDAGASGNIFGNPRFFQVLVPVNHNLIIVVNNTDPANVGVGDPFTLNVEGFIDSAFTDPTPAAAPVPEPGTFVLAGGGMALLWVRRRSRGGKS